MAEIIILAASVLLVGVYIWRKGKSEDSRREAWLKLWDGRMK